LIAYARAEVRAVEGVRLVEGRNNRSWNIEDEAILKKFSGLKIPKAYHHTKKVPSPAQLEKRGLRLLVQSHGLYLWQQVHHLRMFYNSP
jgi:hypothetical protein